MLLIFIAPTETIERKGNDVSPETNRNDTGSFV